MALSVTTQVPIRAVDHGATSGNRRLVGVLALRAHTLREHDAARRTLRLLRLLGLPRLVRLEVLEPTVESTLGLDLPSSSVDDGHDRGLLVGTDGRNGSSRAHRVRLVRTAVLLHYEGVVRVRVPAENLVGEFAALVGVSLERVDLLHPVLLLELHQLQSLGVSQQECRVSVHPLDESNGDVTRLRSHLGSECSGRLLVRLLDVQVDRVEVDLRNVVRALGGNLVHALELDNQGLHPGGCLALDRDRRRHGGLLVLGVASGRVVGGDEPHNQRNDANEHQGSHANDDECPLLVVDGVGVHFFLLLK